MKTCIWIGILLLAGCVTSKPVALPSGHQGLAISCPGTARSITDCMNEAAKECGGAYRVITEENESNGGAYVPVSGGGGVYANSRHRTLIVSCGAS